MKKLSVLLVIGLFCIPMLVYGFTKTSFPSVVSKRISKSIQSIVKLGSRSLDKATSFMQLQEEPEFPPQQNPFFHEPSGAKGTVGGIDLENKKITLLKAVYFDEALDRYVTSDLTICMNEITTYYVDLHEGSAFEAITSGITIICNGPIDFETKEMKYAADVYMGKFVPDDYKFPLIFGAQIKNFDPANRSFDFDYPALDGKMYTIHVVISEQTYVFSYLKATPEVPSGPELGIIPGFVKNDLFMRGDFIINQDFTAVANCVFFYEY